MSEVDKFLDSYDKKSDAKGDGTVAPNVAQGLVTALKALPRKVRACW